MNKINKTLFPDIAYTLAWEKEIRKVYVMLEKCHAKKKKAGKKEQGRMLVA